MPNTGLSFIPKSAKARVFLAIFVFLLVGIFVLFYTAPLPNTSQENEGLQTDGFRKELIAEANKDSDSDGLRDWEEALYKTNPENPDTDGDGTKDGDEIRQNRNPLVRGPKDIVSTPLKLEAPIVFDAQNSTHILTQNIFQDPAFQNILLESGGKLSPDIIIKYLKDLPASASLQNIQPLDTKTLKISDNETPIAVENYLESFANIFIQNGEAFSEGDDLTIARDALTNNSQNDFKKLDAIVAALQKIINEANALAIPKNILWFHEKEIFLLSKTRLEISVLRNARIDPLGALSMIQERLKTKTELGNLQHNDLGNWLLKNNILLGGNAKLFFGIR